MPKYIYKVRDSEGKIFQGQMDAIDARELRKKLDEQNYFIVEYEEKKRTLAKKMNYIKN